MQNLLTALATLCLLLGVHAQGPQIGFCNTYQTTQAFDQAFIAKMQENEEGYSFLLTSGPTYGCQKLSFFPNGTFFYDFIDVTSSRANSSGSYQMKPFSFTEPASITLSSLPFGELGSVLGTVNFNVLVAQEDFVVMLSCINIGLIRTQQVHVLIPKNSSASVAAGEVNATVQEMQVPLAYRLEEVQQTCDAGASGDETLLLLNRLYTRLGFFNPSIPGSGYGGALHSGFHPFVDNPNIGSTFSPNFAQQAQAGFSGFGLQSPSGLQSSVFSQATNPVDFQSATLPLFGQKVIPQVPSGARYELQQLQNPIAVFSGKPSEAAGFGLNPHFPAPASAVSSGFVTQAQQFQQNRPAQQVQISGRQPGIYNSFY